MKMYPKFELHMKDGLIVTADGEIVAIDPVIVDLANELETDLQKARYLHEQPKGQMPPSLDGFTRKSEKSIEMFSCETPIADKKMEETLAFMDELDDVQLVDEMNSHLKGLMELVLFVQDDECLSMDHCCVRRFDTPELGNPLTWTESTIGEAVAEIHGCKVSDE